MIIGDKAKRDRHCIAALRSSKLDDKNSIH